MTNQKSLFFICAAAAACCLSASAQQQWSNGEAVTINAGDPPVTISVPEPNIHSLTNNGTLAFTPSGSVNITGNATSVVGWNGGEGTMTIEGSVTKSGTGGFWIGAQGGTGTVTVASGGLLDLKNNALYVCWNTSGTSRVPDTRGFLDIAGTVKANFMEMTGNFPNGASDPYVDAGIVRLLPGGSLEISRLAKNDRARSWIHFEGGTLKMTVSTNLFHTVNYNSFLYYEIANGCDAIFDTASNNVTFNPANAGSSLTLTGTGGLVKKGGGALAFTLADTNNTFTGNITVLEGALSLGRPLYPTQLVTVHEGASFVPFCAADLPNITYLGSSKLLFTVGGDFNTLNLTTPPGMYFTDRLGGPFAGTTTLNGALTYDSLNSGIPGAPFRLIGQGGTLNLTNNTGLETAHLKLEGAGRFAFLGDRLYTAPSEITLTDSVIYRQEGNFTMTGALGTPAVFNLTGPNQFETITGSGENTLLVGYNGDAVFTATNATMNVRRLHIAGGAGVKGDFIQRGGTVNVTQTGTGTSPVWVGYDNGTGRLDVANGNFIASWDLRVAGNPGDQTNRAGRPDGEVTVSNGIVRCNVLNFTPWWPSADNTLTNRDVGRVYLLEGGAVEIGGNINKNDNGISTLFFDGGTLRMRANQGNVIAMGQAPATLVWTAPQGKFITFDTQNYTNTITSQSGKFYMTGNGGFRKRGTGTLDFFSSRADYKGDTIVEAGTLRMNGVNQIPNGPGFGSLSIASGALFDLNGRDTRVNSITGAGWVTNSSATIATLSLFADNGDYTLTGSFFRGSNINLAKLGTGTLTLQHAGAISTPLFRIEDGTVRLGEYIGGYPFYRFKVEGIDNPTTANSMQFSKLALLNGTENVVPKRIGTLWDATYSDPVSANQTYPGGEPPDKVVNNAWNPDGSTFNNKWLDFRMAGTRSPADQDRVWIRLEFPTAQAITAYNWATANDQVTQRPRSLTAWRLQGSFDGTDWRDIDVKTGYNAINANNTWVEPDGFPVAITGAAPVISPTTAVSLFPAATLEVSGGHPHAIGALGGAGSVVLDNTDLALGGGSTPASFSGTLTGIGNLIFDGTNQRFSADNTATGDIIVRSGTAAVLASGIPHTWFRFTVQDIRDNASKNIAVMQISEFGLYNASGARANTGLTIGPGEFSLTPGQYWTANYSVGSAAQGASNLFDNATSTKWCVTSIPTPQGLANPSAWRSVTMRLPDGGGEIMTYNLATANDVPERDPITWKLESSPDGIVWKLVDARTNFPPPGVIGPPVTERNTWYNGGTPLPLALGHASSAGGSGTVTAIPPGSTVEVCSGATLDISGGTQTIHALRIDATAGGGTITRFTPAPNGTLHLTNVPNGSPTSWVIPITFGSIDNPADFTRWQIIADGTPVNGYRIAYNPILNVITFNAQGTILMVK